MSETRSNFPVDITPEAVQQLVRLVQRKAKPGQFVRVGVKGGGCSGFEYVLRLDDRRLDIDRVIVVEGVEVRCDSKSARFLEGARLVATHNLMQGGLTFENPNAARSCGCGTSFTPGASPSAATPASMPAEEAAS